MHRGAQPRAAAGGAAIYDSRMATYRFSITWKLDFTGRDLAVWTAPAKLRCGDLVLLYEAGSGGGRKAFVAIGRAVTDAVWSYHGDDSYWAWLEWRTVRTPLALSAAKKVGEFSVMGSHGAMKPAVFASLAKRLTAGDPIAARTLRRWEANNGFPRTNEVPIRDLFLASLEAAADERALYPPIRQHLENKGWRELPADLQEASRKLRGPLTSDPDGDYGLRPDLLLSRPKAKRVLVVEVKRSAVRIEGYRNPVDQVLDYSRAIVKALRAAAMKGWTVEPLLVAQELFAPRPRRGEDGQDAGWRCTSAMPHLGRCNVEAGSRDVIAADAIDSEQIIAASNAASLAALAVLQRPVGFAHLRQSHVVVPRHAVCHIA